MSLETGSNRFPSRFSESVIEVAAEEVVTSLSFFLLSVGGWDITDGAVRNCAIEINHHPPERKYPGGTRCRW